MESIRTAMTENLQKIQQFDPEQLLAHLLARIRKFIQNKPKKAGAYGVLTLIALFWLRRRSRRTWVSKALLSASFALRSRTIRNMILAAGGVSWLSRRLGYDLNRPFTTTLAIMWLMYYYFRVIEHGVARYQRTYWNVHIVEKAKLSRTPFHPVVWGYNRHAQTVVCFIVAHLEWLWSSGIKVNREEIIGFDGNKQYLDWLNWTSSAQKLQRTASEVNRDVESASDNGAPIALLIHGLGDDNEHPYMKRFARMCKSHGWRAVAFSYWRFDFGEIRDLDLVIEHIHKENPRAPIIGIAWSAGGHYLMKYLGVKGKSTPLVAAISVSGCFDFTQAVDDIAKNENNTYLKFLSMQVRICGQRHLETDKHIKDKEPFIALKWKSSLDEPLHYYDRFLYNLGTWSSMGKGQDKKTYEYKKNTATHYEDSAFSHVDGVQVSTLVLHAYDDPVVSYAHIDWQALVANPHIIVVTTKRGGHCAWYEGILPFGHTWSERVSANFISAVLETHSHTSFIVDVLSRLATGQTGGSKPTPERMARICSASDLRV